jgi:hypothetical protein
MRLDIAKIVRKFGIRVNGDLDNGNCLFRAALAQNVLKECGILSTIKVGGVLARVGSHRERDVLRFALPSNYGGYFDGYLVGHVWNRVGDDLIDFSVGDWAQCDGLVSGNDVLGVPHWAVSCPSFIWKSVRTLPKWRSTGVPSLGDVWYCPWGDWRPPPELDGEELQQIQRCDKIVAALVANARIRERLEALG